MTDKIVVLCTCASAEEAGALARRVVEARLAACASVVNGVQSIYRWEGKVETAGEWLLIVKSSRAVFPALRTEIEKHHSYEVPEILALGVVDGSVNYLSWMEAQLSD